MAHLPPSNSLNRLPVQPEPEEDQHKTEQSSMIVDMSSTIRDNMHQGPEKHKVHQGPEKNKVHQIQITVGTLTLVGGKLDLNCNTTQELTLNLPTEVVSEVGWQAGTGAQDGFLQHTHISQSGPHAPHQLICNKSEMGTCATLVPKTSNSRISTKRWENHHYNPRDCEGHAQLGKPHHACQRHINQDRLHQASTMDHPTVLSAQVPTLGEEEHHGPHLHSQYQKARPALSRMGAPLHKLQIGDVKAEVLLTVRVLQVPYTEDPPLHNLLIMQPGQLGQQEALQLQCLTLSVVFQSDLGVKELLSNTIVVGHILNHAVQQHRDLLLHRHGHIQPIQLVDSANANCEQGVVRCYPIHGKHGCLLALHLLQLHHGHPPQHGHHPDHQQSQFLQITLFYRSSVPLSCTDAPLVSEMEEDGASQQDNMSNPQQGSTHPESLHEAHKQYQEHSCLHNHMLGLKPQASRSQTTLLASAQIQLTRNFTLVVSCKDDQSRAKHNLCPEESYIKVQVKVYAEHDTAYLFVRTTCTAPLQYSYVMARYMCWPTMPTRSLCSMSARSQSLRQSSNQSSHSRLLEAQGNHFDQESHQRKENQVSHHKCDKIMSHQTVQRSHQSVHIQEVANDWDLHHGRLGLTQGTVVYLDHVPHVALHIRPEHNLEHDQLPPACVVLHHHQEHQHFKYYLQVKVFMSRNTPDTAYLLSRSTFHLMTGCMAGLMEASAATLLNRTLFVVNMMRCMGSRPRSPPETDPKKSADKFDNKLTSEKG